MIDIYMIDSMKNPLKIKLEMCQQALYFKFINKKFSCDTLIHECT